MFCNRYGFSGYGYGFGGPNFFMMIPMLLILFVIVYFIYKAVHGKTLYIDKTSSSSIDILNERFAKGEINEEEYKSKKSQLLK